MAKLDLTKLKKIKSHTFAGKKYKVKVKYLPPDRMAQCDHPETKEKAIIIDPRHHEERDLLKSLLDESLHCFDFRIENDVVDKFAFDIANFLIRAGFGLKN